MNETDGRVLMGAFAHMQAGRMPQAEQICRQVLQRAPRSPDALHLMALIFQRQGQWDSALTYVDKSLSFSGRNYSVHASRASILASMGRLDAAVESYERAVQLEPGALQALCGQGTVLQLQRNWTDACTAFQRVLVLDPRNAVALNGLGLSRLEMCEFAAAEAALRAAIREAGGHETLRASSWNNLGKVYFELQHYDEAAAAYQQCLALTPRDWQVHRNLGYVWLKLSRLDEGRAAFRQANDLKPSVGLQIMAETIIPRVLASNEQIDLCRAEFQRGLEIVLRGSPGPQPLSTSLYSNNLFYLAFHGRNDREIMEKTASFYQELCPDLKMEAPHTARPRVASSVRRIGFFTVNVQDHAVSRCFAKVVCLLAADPRFEVTLISTRDPMAVEGDWPYRDFTGRVVLVEADIAAARTEIARLKLDVMLYQDIGMDSLSYFLAFARLAHAQCVMGGHPVTTGIPQVDYYITTALAEPPDAAQHYSEIPVLLRGLPAVFRHPELPPVMKGREAFGLPMEGALYMCPMKLQKMHPDFDAALEAILRRDPSGHVVLFRDRGMRMEDVLVERLKRSIPDETVRDRIVFLPWLHDYQDFLAVNALADVVLDPFHFGIGSTIIATFAVGTPIVTWPSGYMRGRAGLAFSSLVEAYECVADSQDEYVEKAVAFGRDAALRAHVRATVLRNKHRLFDNESAAHELADVLACLSLEGGRGGVIQ